MKDLQHFIESSDDDPEAATAMARQKAVVDTGRMVYQWRKAADLSQQQLADGIGSKQESISRIERGLSKEGPKLTTLAAIAAACGQRLHVQGVPANANADAAVHAGDSAWAVGDSSCLGTLELVKVLGQPRGEETQMLRHVRVKTMPGVTRVRVPLGFPQRGAGVFVTGAKMEVDDDEGTAVVLDNLQLELSDQLEDLIVQQHRETD